MAKYSRRKVSLDEEKSICTGCIVSTKFIRDFNLLIGSELVLLKSKYLRMIISWCIDYFKEYEEAPFSSIIDIFKAERKNIQNADDVDMIEETIEDINDRYIEDGQKFDDAFIFNQAEKYIRGRALEESAEEIRGLVKQNKISDAERIISEYRRPCKGEVNGIQIFTDENAVNDMFLEQNSVFRPPGPLGLLMGDMLKGDLCYVGGPAKSSKTWSCMEFALMCVREGLNVAWFSLEMSAALMNKRFAQNIISGSFKDIADKVYVPYFDKNNNVKYKKEKIKKLTESVVKRRYKMFKQQYAGNLVVYDGTTSGNTVASIKNTLINAEELEGIAYDVVFVDQLNLIKTFGVKEKRHALDNIALDLKRDIAQEMNMLVFSPVQYNKESLKKDIRDESNISESYSLFSHASLLVSLNQTKEERETGLLRITCSGRHDKYFGTILALQCLDKGRAILDNRWIKEVPNYSDVVCDMSFGEEDEKELEDA